MNYVGIDPGIGGAVASIGDDESVVIIAALKEADAVAGAVEWLERNGIHATYYALTNEWRVVQMRNDQFDSSFSLDISECARTLPAAVAALRKRLEEK